MKVEVQKSEALKVVLTKAQVIDALRQYMKMHVVPPRDAVMRFHLDSTLLSSVTVDSLKEVSVTWEKES